MRDLNERLNALTPAQRALLDFRLQEKKLNPASAPKLVAHAWGEGEPLALSFAQQRLWFLQQLSPDSGLYNTFLGVRLKGALDVAALEQTFDEILRRHKVLCTVFAVEEGQVVARLSSSSGINLQFEDLRDLDAARREAHALTRANEEVRRPFDLSRAPLLRALMLRLGEEDHIVVLTMHHIVSDRWSIDILMQELAALYDAYSKGKRPPLAEPPVQYADFAQWQREYLEGERLEKQLSYWKRQLGGDLPTLELPTDRPRTLLHTSRGERRSCELPARLFESLTALSRREGTTDFMTLLAAFKSLLYRYTGQDDLVVGTPIANRAAAKVQGLIGCFVNTLVLRNDFSGDPNFREALGRVRAACLDAYAQQDVPFERLVEELQPERRLSNTPLFQVMFALNDRHDPVHGRRLLEQTLDMSGLSLTPIDLNSGTVQVDLILHVEKRADRSTCAIEYSTDLFDDATVERMLKHYLMLLEGIVADPDRRLSELPLMTASERRQVLRDWNETATDYGPQLCVHELFAAQAARTPAAVALVGDDGTQVSYDELNRRANGLAHYLRERGVGPETLVGVMMGRSADMIVAMLGILKAGGAYLPLDLSYPKQRLAHMLEDTRTPVLLTQQALLSRLPEHEAEVLCLDTEWDLISRQSADNSPSRVVADNLAYVIYTSGSTGRPKGVCVTHRAINRLVRNTNYVELKPSDRVAQASNASFDAATFEVWGALLHGARLVILSKEMILTPQTLAEQIAEQQISVMFLTTALFNQLANAAPGCFSNVRQLMFGGEAVDARSVERVLSGGSPERLLHVYGPTESTTFTTWYLLRRDADRGASVIPIGLPISNTTTYLLDKNLQPVPAGLIGEIYIGGDGLARGYLNRAELTAEKFFPDPFGREPGGRLYKTGDVARQLDDGNIVFIGRIDSQVKVRGFRIELGEIEEALALHPEVREAVVSAREDVPGERQLVAYVCGDVTATELRTALKERLPDYMVPAVYVMLDEFPLTPNGKIDRKNLPEPDFGGMDAGENYVAPRTPVEEVLASIWAELLRAERVSVEANFFELGGHSLLATQMAARIEESFQVQLPLRTLFEAPTIADLSVAIRRLMGKGDELEGARAGMLLPQVEPAPEHRYLPFPLTEVQQAYWIGRTDAFELGNVSAHGYLELDVKGLDTARLEEALERLIERHDMLRAVFLPDGRQQVLERTPPFRLPVEDWRGLAPGEREAALLTVRDVMSHQVLPSDRWPLFEIRAGLLGNDVVRLFISTDALIGDAWSWQILSREIALYYQNPQAELEPLTGTFRDYVMAELALRETPIFERALGYWRGRLATFPPAPDLPLASRPVAIPQMRFERRTDRLDAKLWRQLKAKGTRRGLTPSGLVLAVFAEALALWSKNKNFTVNLTLFNRLPVHPQVNQVVGDFTSLILLAVNHRPAASFEQRALLLQAQLFDDLDHRYVSGVRVIRELASEGGGAARATMPVVFTSLLNLDTSRAEASPISGQLAYSISQTPQVWLDHQVYERGGDLVFTWDAVEDLFPAGLLDDVFRAFSILLRGLAEADEGWGASRFDLLPPAQLERRAEVNDTAAPLPRKMLHALFDEQVKRGRGAHAAVISAGRTLSYDELYLRSNLIARRLREAGARPNGLVAVVMEKGWEQVAGVLAVLYAGAAYLPVDPELPSERVRYLLDNGEVELVLTQPWIDGRFEWPERVRRIRVGEEEIEGVEPQPLEPLQEPTDLAYVIYTSGSTGAPKGVMIDHLGAVNTIVDINSRFQIAPADRVLALSKLSFDLSVYDIFGALAAGATVVMPDAATPPDPAHWASLLGEHGVTVWNSVPALMVMLADHLREQGERLPASLRLVLMSGDWIPVTLPAHIRELTDEEVQIVSLGGATEGSIWSILYPIGEVSPEWRSIPYGYPMVNQHMYVFDRELMPTPVWVTGEIYIGGAGVAKGYWRDEEKTAAKFVTHEGTGERLYRTGDLGRYLPDGTIEFLGREDFQVKIQGYRVELGEIEAALAHHPQVRENIVVARADAHGNKSLVAYLVAEGDDAPTPGELRNYLTDYLPEYMLPSAYVMLDALPLTPNGKIDRNALPEPDQLRPELDSAYLAPRTPTEQLLESIWADVLGLARIGVHDDFFVLGGHSMMAARALTQVREAFRVELSLRSLFESPTIAQMAQLVDAALGESGGLAEPPLAPVERDKPLPLSFAQQRLWFLENLLHGSTAYSMPFAVRLHGELDAEALESSIGEIVNRHEALRTTFLSVDGKPAQVINPPRRISIPVVTLENFDAALREAEALRLGREEASRPFDLNEGPLMRALLLRLSPLEHVLFLTMHHIVSDGWSLGIFLRELGILYQGFHAVTPASLPALPIQYADFAVWQRAWLQGEVFERQLAYWRERLAGAPPVLQLPGSRPRPVIQTFRGGQHPLSLSPALTAALKELSRKERATLFMLLLAAFKLVLHRCSGEVDIVIGTPVANRNRRELEPLIGFFANTLVLRTDLSGNPSFSDLLKRVRETALSAYAHQDVPFERLVEELQPERALSHTPLFQVMLVLQNTPMDTLQLPGLTLQQVEFESGTVHFDLTLRLWEDGETLGGRLEYSADLYDEELAARLAGLFNNLLESVVADTETRVSEVQLLTETERRQILSGWNPAAPAVPPAAPLAHHYFEAQARRNPQAVAVSGEGAQLTYGELDGRANGLAHRLRASGVGAETRVAICMQRSADYVVGVLGILKAGGAWVPLDPGYPAERIAFTIEDAKASVLLTQSELLDKLDSHRGETICLDTEWPEIERRPDAPPPLATRPGNIAYIIYTSGSTGVPKGVMITHENLCHYVEAMHGALGLAADDVYLHTASFGFSSSVRQLLVPLARGARVLIASAEEIGKPVELFKLVRRERVTLMDVVPSYWRTCINELSAVGAGAREELLRGNDLRLVLSASESLPSELPRAWSAELGHEADLVNMLGHTETTGIVATHAIAPEVDAHSPIVPVGRPIDGTRIYLLDSYLNPVPAGMPGEIHVGGQGIGRGYLDRPELTAERFIPDPFADTPGARMFKTGDIGRHRPDGTLEYLERKDQQVKIRGFRVELGEMEALLRTHPSVREAAVIARPDAAGFLGLAAFVVARDGQKQTPAELRGFLHSKAPGYMIPHAFVVLEQLPLTATGKIDRRALAALEPPARGAAEEEIALPRNPVEEVLARIWSDVLRVARVGVYDNFFALGGHSLIATQVISRIRDAFGVELPLRSIFESPTVAALGEAVEAARRSAQGLQAPPITPVARDGGGGGNLPLSFAQQRLWFMHLFEPESPAYTIPTVVRMSGELDAPALKRSFEELQLRHEILRTNFVSPGGLPVQVVGAPRPFDLPLTDLTGLSDAEQGAEIRRRAEREMRRPADLAEGSLMRGMLLRLGAQEHVLLLFMHHIISDGWSVGIFFKEMAALYEAFSTGRPHGLADLPIQYADFAHWQQNWLRGEVLERHLAYWRDQLADVPASLDLPTDHPRPAVQTFRGATRMRALSKELTGAIGALCRRENVTEFMLLLAAFQTLLSRYTGQTDICVGTPIAGRNRSETEELIGFFVNTLVIRGDLADDPSFNDFLQRVREQTLGAYEHQELPFEHLVEALKPQRMLNQNPIFQVLFVFQNAPASSIELTNLRLRRIELDSGTAKFDLTLGIGETPDGLSVTFEYSTDLFAAETIERMLEHYERLLSAVVRAPDTRLSRLPLLGQRERQLLLRDFNDTARPARPASPALLHELVAAQAARTPDRVAVVDARERLTYAELEQLSEAMAGELRRRGVRAESIVGVMLGRGARMVATVLGVLKAGGAYLPLDAQYPAERLTLMLGDSGAGVLITEGRLLERVPSEHGAEVVLAEEVWARHEGAENSTQSTQDAESETNGAHGARPERAGSMTSGERAGSMTSGERAGSVVSETGAGREVSEGNAAYVIYTSGSTGRPKGVVIEHRSAVEMAEWSGEVYGEEELRGVLAATSLSFDLSVYEMFAPLSRGGAVVVVESALEMGELAEEVTLINTVPSVMSELVRMKAVPPSVRTVNLAGEALQRTLVDHVYELGTVERVFNLYGPSEDTTYSTYALIERRSESAPTIGRPVTNSQAYVLDAHLNPVPLGVIGELYLGGEGLARGYLNRPDLTAERFVPDPFSPRPGARLYRTGDLARFLPDGQLEFLGRTDRQVKVRGFRIELGEVEAALLRHEAVREAVVVAGAGEGAAGGAGGAQQTLVAYVVKREDAELQAEELRRCVRERLPEYMTPGVYAELEELPLLPNGKVDRGRLAREWRAFAGGGVMAAGEGEEYIAPEGEVAQELASMWAALLGVERVSAGANFFQLGGHSLVATQLMALIEERFGVRLPLRRIFETPTVSSLAQSIELLLWATQEAGEASGAEGEAEGEI